MRSHGVAAAEGQGQREGLEGAKKQRGAAEGAEEER